MINGKISQRANFIKKLNVLIDEREK